MLLFCIISTSIKFRIAPPVPQKKFMNCVDFYKYVINSDSDKSVRNLPRVLLPHLLKIVALSW